MTDNRRIKDRLRGLAAEASPIEAGWRQIGSQYSDKPLAAVLSEIDETLLPREISFRNDHGDILSVEAANRRLRRIMSAAQSELASFSHLVDQALSEPTKETMDQIGRMFQAFQKDSEALWVRTTKPSQIGETKPMGISAIKLAKAWSIELEDRSEIDLERIFETFADALTSGAEAWARTKDGTVVASSGANNSSEWVENCISVDWQSILQSLARPIAASYMPSLCVLGSGKVPGTHLLVAVSGHNCIVSLIHPSRLTGMVSEWRRLGL